MNLKHFSHSFQIKDLFLITLMLVVIIMNSIDFIEDGINQEDAWLKAITTVLSIWGIIVLIRLILHRNDEILSLHKTVQSTKDNLAQTHLKLKRIGQEYSKYLHKQFDEWGLTQSEKEVAIAILKGLSFEEIAEMRNTKNKTVRYQASSLYKKSKVSNRHEFSAWFFEDLLI